ncbi:rhodanese homology domain-containing protein [Thauera linaloolentis]|uniref:Rhodanese-like protein n=1 Tax=Thauera linaloolentis (strain DSM 12138 / JCM 21573 / CCUG 41526 / CIP 105981 / IAM 15112 / NBRC 102519 / 47Lol) TaxID=1123367 RepID=N6YVU0_THAL4|nr:rhodanese homology domain-containing protein [Thauera linaloolentis]ENO86253.1 rhodanese-like protein [Thauera linaloolentis 47Lol = DSM 12138]MCM8566941.1 rhodanese homology domain-containing protein [Thauera linaloolentis]
MNAIVPPGEPHQSIPQAAYADVRAALLARREIALLDVREEDPHARAHPLFAANLPLARIELDAYARLPRRDASIVTIDDGEGLAEVAARRLLGLGYTDVRVFKGGVAAWRDAGGELFRDVNVPSKSFGELVEARRHTPSLAAEEVQALIDGKADVVVVDVRRFDEYQTMNIPGSTSVPGAELVLRIAELAPDPATQVIVNCAGRTRSIIGTQSLVNAGLPNPVAALRNGTIGWTLAGQALEKGAARRFPEVSDAVLAQARQRARSVADRAGVRRTSLAEIGDWRRQQGRTTYFFDVRTPEEYEAGHLPGFLSVPGGQLVQETEMVAPVRGARIVLADSDGVRADMTASWLAQMAWEVHVVDGVGADELGERGAGRADEAPVPVVQRLSAEGLSHRLAAGEDIVVIDFTTHANYLKRHVPGAWWALRSQLAEALARIPKAARYVLTCGSSRLARYVVPEVEALVDGEVWLLDGGNAAWFAAGLPEEGGESRLASPPIDRYRRPYEGTDNAREAMQAYLDWEFGLVAQLGRDGTHHFEVI